MNMFAVRGNKYKFVGKKRTGQLTLARSFLILRLTAKALARQPLLTLQRQIGFLADVVRSAADPHLKLARLQHPLLLGLVVVLKRSFVER